MHKGYALLSILLFGLCFVTSFSFATQSDLPRQSRYSGQIEECIQKNAKGQPKTITSYVCPDGTLTPQQIAFQVIMDLEFQRIDREVEGDLKTIQSTSTKDIGAIDTFVKGMFDETGIPEGRYTPRYRNICNTIVHDEAMKHFGNLSTDNDAKNFFNGQSVCNVLVDKKIGAYKQAAWIIGERSVLNSYQKDKHTFMTRLKELYEKFLNKWTILIGQIGRIKSKWPSKTRTCM